MNMFKLMKNYPLVLLFLLSVFAGCKKETETLITDAPSDYVALHAGKYITYKTDSTVFINFGTATVVRSYQEKNEVDAQTTDNLGRPSYRVFRYVRDEAGSQPWKPAGSYYITIGAHSVEYIENNLRAVKLSAPIKKDISWKGNGFFPQSPYTGLYNFTVDNGIQDWQYRYTNVRDSFSYKGQILSDVITVKQVDDSLNVPITNRDEYASVTRAIDKYARGIGLVEQELTLWEYQYDNSRGSGYKNGFGVKRRMIDHN